MVGILYLNLLGKYIPSFNTKLALGVTIICISVEPTNYLFLLVHNCNNNNKCSPHPWSLILGASGSQNPGETTASSHLPPTTNGKVESPKEGRALILLLLFLCISFPLLPLQANHLKPSYIHCLPLKALLPLSLLLQKVLIMRKLTVATVSDYWFFFVCFCFLAGLHKKKAYIFKLKFSC